MTRLQIVNPAPKTFGDLHDGDDNYVRHLVAFLSNGETGALASFPSLGSPAIVLHGASLPNASLVALAGGFAAAASGQGRQKDEALSLASSNAFEASYLPLGLAAPTSVGHAHNGNNPFASHDHTWQYQLSLS